MEDGVPPFEPHPLLRGGHAQTIVGRYLTDVGRGLPSTYHELDVGDGDRLSVLETVPDAWRPGGPAAVLVHGLAGCARSPYLLRPAIRLAALGVRVVRVNLRGAGSGFGAARGIYHAGRTEDLRRVCEWLARRAPGSPIALVGFSLGGNLVLKLAADAAERSLEGLDYVIAANPPIDLASCCERMKEPTNRLYDRNFVHLLRRKIERLHEVFPELGPVDLMRATTVYGFDDLYTAPRNGYAGAADYYERSSAGPVLERITVPGLVIHAEDDPFIPVEPFLVAAFPAGLALELIPHGGHLGYVARHPWGGGRRWLDARLTSRLAARWTLPFAKTQDGVQPTPSRFGAATRRT